MTIRVGLSEVWPVLGHSPDITSHWEQGPRDKSILLLDRALEIVRSVPYEVTLRWLFYNLFQEGWFADQKPGGKKSPKKLAYENFGKLLSRLRHSSEEFYERWPIDLADDRRDPFHRSEWNRDVNDWLEDFIKYTECNVDRMVGQDAYVMIAFEAEAMQSQFKHYTEFYGVSLWPFSGATSIPYKKRMAKHIEEVSNYFGLPVTILYFGDYDPMGLTIPESAFRHVRKWCNVEFDAYRVGLNQDDIRKYNIVEDPDEPGKYQWEAINDRAAREIITGALDSLLRRDDILEIERKELVATTKVKNALREIDLGGDQ